MVTVIVPIYNSAAYLAQCLQSLAAQTLKDLEIICVDDGSTDASGEILTSFARADSRFRVIRQPNGGYGKAMNAGLAAAGGEYIGIVEADDFAAPDMFAGLYRAAKKYGADVVKSNYYQLSSSGKTEREVFFEALKGCPYGSIVRPADHLPLFYNAPGIWSGLYRRDFLNQAGIRFLETPGASYQDTSFWLKVLLAGPSLVCLKQGWLRYRTDNEASSVHNPGKVFCICDEIQEARSFASQKALGNDLHVQRLLYGVTLRTYSWNYRRLGPAYRYAFLLRMAQDLKPGLEQGLAQEEYFPLTHFTPGWHQELTRIVFDPQGYFLEESAQLAGAAALEPELPLTSRLPGQIIRLFYQGNLGLRVIWGCMKGWLYYKLGRGGPYHE